MLGVSPNAHAFGLLTHASISYEALDASSLLLPADFNPTYLEFDPTARFEVSVANAKVDATTLFGTVPGTEKQHFDDSLMHDGADHLIDVRKNIMNLLARAENIMNGSMPSLQRSADFQLAVLGARKLLGSAHHSIQDFYAHSNWVESHPKRVTAPMTWIGNDKRNAFINGTSMCQECGGTPINSGGLFSGTFRWPEYGMTQEVLKYPKVCIHGPGETSIIPPVDLPNGCPGDELRGIAKDEAGPPDHAEAVEDAILASAAYTTGILVEARELGYYVALCGFLGYTGPFSCLKEQTQTQEFTLPFTEFSGLANYKTAELFTWDVPKFDATKGQIRSIATKWEWEVNGTANCPTNPGSAITGANICLALRRIGALGVSSPDMNVSALYCNTSPDLRSNTCGLNAVMPDTFGFTYIVWPGGTEQIEIDEDDYPPTELRHIANDLSAYAANSPGETFKLDGSFVSRLLFNLGVNNGTGREPSTFVGSGAFLSFTGEMKIRITITYEYVPRQQ